MKLNFFGKIIKKTINIKFILKKHVVILMFFASVLILSGIAWLFPGFGANLTASTEWLSNITPLIILLAGYFLKEEITNWHYKKRSEAASEIIGKFRTCVQEVIYWVNARIMTPASGNEAAERKVHLSIEKYIQSALEPSAQFPIHLRKELDQHFNEIRRLANVLSSAITVDSTSQGQAYTESMKLKASTDLQTVAETLSEIQDFLDLKLGQYLSR